GRGVVGEGGGGVEGVRVGVPGRDDRRDERSVVGDDLVVLRVPVRPLDGIAGRDVNGRRREGRRGDPHALRRGADCRVRGGRDDECERGKGRKKQSAHVEPPVWRRLISKTEVARESSFRLQDFYTGVRWSSRSTRATPGGTSCSQSPPSRSAARTSAPEISFDAPSSSTTTS